MTEQGFQIGWIPYLNLRPMLCELNRLAEGVISIKSGHPTQVNKWLCENAISIAPCSSINLLKASQADMALPMGVAADGEVQSVYLGFYREHLDKYNELVKDKFRIKKMFDEEKLESCPDFRTTAKAIRSKIERRAGMPSIYYSSASAASHALVKIFMSLFYGATEAELNLNRVSYPISSQSFLEGHRSIEMVIGDEALSRRSEFAGILDLGQMWKDITGLPFVFAVWQTSSQTLPKQITNLLQEAARLSSVKMRIDPREYFPNPIPVDIAGAPIDLVSYWQVIQYVLTPRHLQGLLLYLNLYSTLFDCTQSELIPARLARWGGQWSLHS